MSQFLRWWGSIHPAHQFVITFSTVGLLVGIFTGAPITIAVWAVVLAWIMKKAWPTTSLTFRNFTMGFKFELNDLAVVNPENINRWNMYVIGVRNAKTKEEKFLHMRSALDLVIEIAREEEGLRHRKGGGITPTD